MKLYTNHFNAQFQIFETNTLDLIFVVDKNRWKTIAEITIKGACNEDN